MPLRLIQAGPSDLPAVVALMNAAFRGAGPSASWNTEAAFMDGDRTSLPLLQAEVSAHPNSFLLITGDANSLQGCVWLQPMADNIWYLGWLTIDPGLQNAGLGRDLLVAAEGWAQDRGARTIQMKVIQVRDTLIAWYQRRGYHLTGETHPFPYDDQRFGTPRRADLHFVVLEKSLAA